MKNINNRDKINFVKHAIREKFAFPGGYEILGVTGDGALLCSNCMKDNFKSILWSIKNSCDDGWKVETLTLSNAFEPVDLDQVYPEDCPLQFCGHCNRILNP